MDQALAALVERYVARSLPLTQSAAHRDTSLLELSRNELLKGTKYPDAVWSGLLLLAGCWDESHTLSQDLPGAEGSYWHAIAHRIEPDSFNAGYWFRKVGTHPIFPALRGQAEKILEGGATAWRLHSSWDPFLFIEWCDDARHSGASEKVTTATNIQQAECRLLLEFCLS